MKKKKKKPPRGGCIQTSGSREVTAFYAFLYKMAVSDPFQAFSLLAKPRLSRVRGSAKAKSEYNRANIVRPWSLVEPRETKDEKSNPWSGFLKWPPPPPPG